MYFVLLYDIDDPEFWIPFYGRNIDHYKHNTTIRDGDRRYYRFLKIKRKL